MKKYVISVVLELLHDVFTFGLSGVRRKLERIDGNSVKGCKVVLLKLLELFITVAWSIVGCYYDEIVSIGYALLGL